MNTAIITPIYNEDKSKVFRCLESIANQTVIYNHYIYIDGRTNFDESLLSKYQNIKIFSGNITFSDSGDTPRAILASIILRQNYDHVYLLDVDNFFFDKSVEMINKFSEQENCEIVFSRRSIINQNGLWQNVKENKTFVDMNCISFHGLGIRHLKLLNYIPRDLSEIDDRILYQMIIKNQFTYKFFEKISVIYENKWGSSKKRLSKKEIKNKVEFLLSDRQKLLEIIKLETGLKFSDE